MNFLRAIIFFFLGTIFGSFANVLIYRLPKGLSLGGRSACPGCGKVLGFWELWPILSFLGLRGKCKACRMPIALRYFAVEIIMGLLFAGIWQFFLPHNILGYLRLAEILFLAFFGVLIFTIDWEYFLILDGLVIGFCLIFFLLNLITDFSTASGFKQTLSGIVGAALGALPFYLIWKFSQGRLMGFGDVKLMLALGLALGFPMVWVAVFFAVILGGAVGFALLLFTRATLKTALPFGCFLSIAAILTALFGSGLLSWYLSVIGV